MRSITWLLTFSLALLVCGLATMPAAAQDDNPFGGGDEAPADENPFGGGDAPAEMPAEEVPSEADAAADDSPFGDPGASGDDPAADAAAEAAAADAAAAPRLPDDPAAAAVLESKPETPFELLRAIRILADLGYAKLAMPFADQLTAKQLSVEEKASLFSKFDSAQLMRIARNPELAAKLGPFIDQLFQATDAVRRDPARLAKWIGLLGDPSENVRAQATQALLQAREAAVGPLVQVLADPARAKEHRLAKRILIQLGGVAVGPLVAVLDSPDPALKAQVAEVLGAMQATSAVASLLVPLVAPDSSPELRGMAAAAIARTSGRVPAPAEALALIEHAARRALAQSRDESGDYAPVVEHWTWDDATKLPVMTMYTPTASTLATAVRLAAHLYELDRESPERRRLYLTALLQAAKLGGGLDNPLPTGDGTAYAQAAKFGPHAIEDVLASAMAEGYVPAATAAAQILGDIGTLDLIAHAGAAPSTLVRAAHQPDRRLRFAATAAIMKLAPQQPFAGSSYVTESLAYFANSYGVPRVLIAHPLSTEGNTLAGLAAALGYDADVATTGRQAYELATASPDYEWMLAHSAINRPSIDELVAQLRRDGRTARLPLGIIAPLEDLQRIKDFTRRASEAEAFLQPQNDAELRLYANRLLGGAGRSHVSVERRRAQSLAALDWLLALAQSDQKVFNVGQLEPQLVPLMYHPETAGKAIELLSEIGTERAQEALVQLADSPAQPLATRQAAVSAFARSVRRHGTLLTTDEIHAQYDLYNYNAGRNRETHEVLGSLLDVIEFQGDPPPQTATSGP